ncbi:hypothetical protein Phou_044930 [Phytohabitans houttuyneae]|uniref:Uncharacterized protein n=1 Tax=Phytohabitans houttuyneae TaxID=1076126 RepID=A0A6V8K538_9ACTN|nr:hypothetical protein Phou_044930 [Phytohabitans houttuyneae]
MAVELEVPVRVRREPVVVAPVQDYGVVVSDAALGEQGFELLLVDEVPAHRVLQVVFPVELDGARNVAGVIRRGVFIHLDEDHTRRFQVLFGPVG